MFFYWHEIVVLSQKWGMLHLQYRQDCPLTSPINRVDFMAWAWRKSGAKIKKNQLPSNSSSAASSLSSFSLRHGLWPSSQLPPAWPPSSPPTQILTSGRATTIDPFLSMLQIFFFLLPPTTNDKSQFLHQCHHTSLSPSTNDGFK